MITDYFKLSYRSIRSRRLRSWLTMIGIFIGVTAVVSLISLGQGLQSSINEEFQKMGTNRILVSPGSGSFGPAGGSLTVGKITDDDLGMVRRVKGVDFAAEVLSKTAKVEYNDEVKYLSVWGFPTDGEGEKLISSTKFFDVEKGRQLKKGDSYKAVLGYNIAEDTFDKKIISGGKIKINDYDFTVVGVQKKAGTGVHDAIVRVPLETAREIFDEPTEISSIFVFTQEGFEPSKVAEAIKKELRRSRGVEEGEEDFSVQTAEQTIGTLNTILDVVQIFIIGIAAISLIVGGIGIMNTMYTTVMERTKEIGIMKAVGAKNGQIMFLFLVEAGMLGLTGGLIGLGLGLGIAKIGELIAVYLGATIFKIQASLTLAIGALLFSFLVGIISGLLPARQASLMQPIDALRKVR